MYPRIFLQVVSLDVLLTVLARDQPIISQKITRLLMPSYFPTKVSIEEACSRCITLIKRSPMAGARFCEFAASEGASLKSIMELVRVLINLVSSSDKLDANYIDGLLLSAKYLCSSISSEPCYKNDLKDLFTGEKLECLLSVAQSGCARSSLFNIVSLFSPDGFTDLLEECMQLITNCRGLSGDLEKQAEVRSGHKFFQACDALDVMFEAMALILQKSAYRCHIKFGTEIPKLSVSPAKRKKCKFSGKILSRLKHFGGKKCLSFEDDYFVAVGMSWQVKDLLSDEKMKSALLSSQTIETIFLTLKIICEVSIVQCLDYDFMDVSPVLAYASLALHMTLQKGSQSITSSSGTKNKIVTDSSSSEASAYLMSDNKTMLYCDVLVTQVVALFPVGYDELYAVSSCFLNINSNLDLFTFHLKLLNCLDNHSKSCVSIILSNDSCLMKIVNFIIKILF